MIMERNLCKQTWFNPNSKDDEALTTYENTLEPLEVDNLEALKTIQSDDWTPKNEFVIFQQWGEDEEDGSRKYFYFDKKSAQKLGEIIKDGPIHKLILIFTTVETGALETFAKTLTQNQLEFLGIFWALSDDSIVDNATSLISEIIMVANHLQLSRLSILTPEFNEKIENLFAEKLKENTSLKIIKILRRDDENNKYETIKKPNIDLELKNR